MRPAGARGLQAVGRAPRRARLPARAVADAARRRRRAAPSPPPARARHARLRDRRRGAAARRGHPRPPRPSEQALDREAGRDPARPRRRHRHGHAAPDRRRSSRASRRRGPTTEQTVRGPRMSAAPTTPMARRPRRRRASPAARASTSASWHRLSVDGVEYVAVRQACPRAAPPPRCSPRSCREIVSGLRPRRTCAGTTPSCPTPARSAGWSRCWATRSSRCRCRRWPPAGPPAFTATPRSRRSRSPRPRDTWTCSGSTASRPTRPGGASRS